MVSRKCWVKNNCVAFNKKFKIMIKNIFFLSCLLFAISAQAQDFNKNLATAKSSYGSGNLEDARFAMQQMLTDIDILVGKEMIKILPSKFDALAVNPKADNVTANTGFSGVVIHRDYAAPDKTASLDIMSNSPLIASLNAILSIPFVGNSGDGTQKVVKVQGYKSVLQKTDDTETGKVNYTLQIPLNSTLITLTGNNTTEAEMLKWAGTLPMPQIAKMVQ
jgi:hypothetical protein